MTGDRPIDVLLTAIWIEGAGYRYDVFLDGKVIVRHTRDPEHEAARALHVRGFRGPFRTVDFHTGTPRMIHDIDKAAGLRTVERDDRPPTVVQYRRLSEEIRGLLGAHTYDRGRGDADATFQSTASRTKAAGDETCAHGPMSDEERARARMHRAGQGRVVADGVVLDSHLPDKRDGGEGGATPRRVLPPADVTVSRAHPSHQGRTVPTEAVCGAGQPAKAAGGETYAGSRRVRQPA